MKAKHLSLATAALIVAVALWFAWSVWRTDESPKSGTAAESQTPDNLSTAEQPLDSPARLAPPDPNRRFSDFTPEERVGFARKGHGPGG